MRATSVFLFAALVGAASHAAAGETVYVPMGGAGKVVVIDAERDRVVGTIPGTEEAHGLAGTPDGDYLVAGSFAETAHGESALPSKPEGMSEDEHRAHHQAPAQGAAAKTDGVSFVSLISIADRAVTRRVAVPGAVHHTAVTPDGRYAIATLPRRGAASVVDLSTFEVIKTLETGSGANYAVASNDGARVYVSNGAAGTVSEIATEDWSLRRNLRAGATPEHMVLSPDGRALYVANAEAGEVTAIALPSGEVARTYDIGGELHGIDLPDDGKILFVSAKARNKVVAIDLGNGERREVALAPAPYHLTAVRGAGKLYVSSAKAPKMWVLDQPSLKLLGEIPIGGKGHQMVVVSR